MSPFSPEDQAAVSAQLGRTVRGVAGVAHRCDCGLPDVVTTLPRLPDGTPFPTLYYLTCPRATAAVSTLESQGIMRQMTDALADNAQLAADHLGAHESYLRERHAIGEQEAVGHVEEIDGISAGGMPDRVKCLHVLVGHALAAGPGVNPLGDEALQLLTDLLGTTECWGGVGRCVNVHDEEEG